MSKPLFLICFLLITQVSFAQKIHFTDTTNKWIVFTTTDLSSTVHLNSVEKYHYSGIKTINGYNYSILMKGAGIAGYIREDTTTNKVYILDVKDTDRILFNFNAKIGDHISYFLPDTVWVIDSVYMNNYWHKRFYLYSDYIIEGIGCFFDRVIPEYMKYYNRYSLICFSNNNVTPVAKVPLFSHCTDSVLAVSEVAHEDKQLTVYPQPATEAVTIALPALAGDGRIYLYNTSGQIVYQLQYEHEKELNIKNEYWHGVYFYRVINSANNISFSGKINFR